MTTETKAPAPTGVNEGMTVSMQKLTEGVKTVFMGVLEILGSIQPEVAHELVDAFIPKENAPAAAPAKSDHKPEPEPATTTPATPSVVPITLDDITKVIVAKIKQKRSNNEAIGKLLTAYHVQKVSELKQEQYEAFVTDLAQI